MNFISSIFNKTLSKHIKKLSPRAEFKTFKIQLMITEINLALLSTQQLVHASRFLDSRMV